MHSESKQYIGEGNRSDGGSCGETGALNNNNYVHDDDDNSATNRDSFENEKKGEFLDNNTMGKGIAATILLADASDVSNHDGLCKK